MREEQAIFNLEIKKKSGLSINPDIHHSKVFSSGKLIIELFISLFNHVSVKIINTGLKSVTVQLNSFTLLNKLCTLE